MQAPYFAYGSNLLSTRMRGRAPSARALGVARLEGYRLTTDKRGRDGSAKANLRPEPGGRVWGVLWSLSETHWAPLDVAEGGYERIDVEVVAADGSRARALTYASTLLTEEPVLAAAYKRLLVEGAREHGLPAEWIALLEALPGR
jgi:hypothetical protein